MRKIKLMALLLAALMIVTAFAGCAGVKKEELDALDVRVQALEDLLNGQQKDLEDIKAGLDAVNNQEILDAIESVKTDLQDKIDDVNARVDENENKADTPVVGGVSAETKTEQQKALALIEVKRAEFAKAVDEYSEEDYKKISEALGTATGAVNAATTVDAVKAAMTALDSELAKYMTYAMKAYDYYCKLLGNVNADAGDLVEEAKDFLKEVKAVFGTEEVEDFEGKVNGDPVTDPEAYIAEVYYLVSEGSKPAKDEYIDIYNAIEDLCTLYTAKSGTKDIPYIDEDGDIAVATLKTVKGYTTDAEDLVERINEELGENFVYGTDEYEKFGEDLEEGGLYATYEAFVEAATLLGGEKLAKLVTNASEIVAAEETYKLIEEAVEAFDKATKLKAGKYGDVFYYYTELENKTALETVGANDKDVWAADEYEKVADLLADWIADYELSEDNVLAIIGEKKGADFYTSASDATGTYVYNAHLNALLVEAFNSFKAIAEKIADLNEVSEASIDMVLAYDEIEELFAEYVVLQEETDDDEVEYPANLEITLDINNFKTIVAEADLFDEFADERLAAAFDGKDMDDFLEVNGLIDLYTFEADVDQLEDDKTYNEIYFDVDKDDEVTDNREYGDIYVFLTETYEDIKDIAKAINTKIENLVKDVAAKKLATNQAFIELEGKYIALTEEYVSEDVEFDAEDNVYVLYTDLYKKAADREDYFETFEDADADEWTIEAFKVLYPEFESMIDVAEFDAAKKTMADRMETLFKDAYAVVDLVEAIDYVRTDDIVIYEDENGNGKYDEDTDTVVGDGDDVTRLVSLNDKAAVDTAWNKYDAWVKLGGAVNMTKFANVVVDDEVIDDVYYMEPLIDPSEVRAAIALVRELDLQVGQLQDMAANFVATIKNVKAVDAATAFTVNLDTNRLWGAGVASNSVHLQAWTKFTAATNEAARDNDGTYTIVDTASPWKTVSYKTDCYDGAAGNDDLKANSWSKKDLLMKVQEMYSDFYFANVEYVADAKNNYEDDKTDYYQSPEYVAYADVTTAVADYTKYDLASVKGYVLNTYNADTNAQIRSLRKQINAATTLEEVESILYAYVAEYNDNRVTADALNAYAIYDFARLASLEIVTE